MAQDTTIVRRVIGWMRFSPFTWIIVGVTAAVSLTRALLPREVQLGFDSILSTGFDSVAVEHHWAAVIGSAFVVHRPLVLVLIALLLGLSERVMGTRRTAVVYFVVAILGVSVGLLIQALGIQLGDLWAQQLRGYHSVDALLPLVGTLMAASGWASPLLGRRIRLLTLAGLLMFLLYSGQPADLYKMGAAVVGLLIGLWFAPNARLSLRVSSHSEARSLLAALVAITALGPLITIVSPHSFGPLKPLGLLFKEAMNRGSDVGLCVAGQASRACVEASALARLDGFGPVLLTFLPLVALLVAAFGILRGRRVGLWLAVAINLMMAVVAAVYYGIFPHLLEDQFFAHENERLSQPWVLVALAVAVPLGIAAVLVAGRRFFPRDFRGDSPGQFWAAVGGLFVGLSALYLALGWLARDQFTPTATLEGLLADLPERFIPVGYLTFERIDIDPVGGLARAAYLWVGPAFWAGVVVLAVLFILRGTVAASGVDDARLRELLHAGAGGSLSWMTTWRGNTYWSSDDGRAFVAYRVIAGVALALAEPVCAPERKPEAVREFAAFATDHGWTPVFYSVTDDLRPVLTELHWSMLQVAEETVVYPAEFTLSGKKMQDIRTSINRASKAGVTTLWTRYDDLTPEHSAQIHAISDAWVGDKELPEMGFTLGGITELQDPEVALMLAVDADNTVIAVTSWLPTLVEGRVDGWTLDFMRRGEGTLPGVMEFLIAESILRGAEDGVRFVSLSGAPLARSDDGGPEAVADADVDVEVTVDATIDRLLVFLSRTLEPVYGFRSLLLFKKKFRPELRPLYLAYPDALALPAIGLSIVRAYVPDLTAKQAVAALNS